MKSNSRTKKEWVTLIEGAQQGKKDDFEELCRLKAPNILFLCKNALNNWEDAEDAAQEVMIKLQKDIATLKNPESFPSWLDRLCLNICLTMRRKQMKEQFDTSLENGENEYQDFSEVSFPANIIETAEMRKKLMEAVESLPYTFRMAIVLHYYEGLKATEIAEAMGITLAMAKHYIQRGRAALKDKIHPEGHSDKKISMLIALPIIINSTDMITAIERSKFVLQASGIPLVGAVAKTAIASKTVLAVAGSFVATGMITVSVVLGIGDTPNPFVPPPPQNGTIGAVSNAQQESHPAGLVLPPASPGVEPPSEQAPQPSHGGSTVGESPGNSSSIPPRKDKAGAAMMGQIFLNSPTGATGVANITVELVSATTPHNVVSTVKTMGGEHAGWYMFENLEPGEYLIRPILPAYVKPLPVGDYQLKDGYLCYKKKTVVFTLQEKQIRTLSLPVYQTGTIYGSVVPSQQALAGALPGIIIKLYDKQNNLLMETTTKQDGSYQFKAPPIAEAGGYTVRFYIPGSLGITVSTSALSVEFVPGNDKTIAPIIATDDTPPSLEIITTNDPASPAYHRAEAFTITTFDTGTVAITWALEDGAATVASGTTTKPGNALDGLAPGVYVLTVTATDRVGNTTTAQAMVCLG